MSGNLQRKLDGVTAAYTNSLLTATGAETVHDTTVQLNFCINGKQYTKSGTNADQTTPTTDYNTAAAFNVLTGTATAGQGTVIVWAYTSGGVVKCMQGTVTATDVSGNFELPPEFPVIPDDVCPFAYQILKKYGTAATFTFGTSNWSDATASAIVNIAQLPDRPQVA